MQLQISFLIDLYLLQVNVELEELNSEGGTEGDREEVRSDG